MARAKHLLGPWEKYAQNPILTNNDTWTCPGHGTAVERNGRWFMLHHAYRTDGFAQVGRQGVLSEFEWTAAGWPRFFNDHSTPATPAPIPAVVADEFAESTLSPAWEWPVEDKPVFALSAGQLRLTARPNGGGAALGRPTLAARYQATATLLAPTALPSGTTAGLAALGDPNNSLRLTAGDNKLRLWERRDGKDRVLAETTLPPSAVLRLRLRALGNGQFRFSWSPNGTKWTDMQPVGETANGDFLPPWDRGVRVGVVALGPSTATVSFERFELDNEQ